MLFLKWKKIIVRNEPNLFKKNETNFLQVIFMHFLHEINFILRSNFPEFVTYFPQSAQNTQKIRRDPFGIKAKFNAF